MPQRRKVSASAAKPKEETRVKLRRPFGAIQDDMKLEVPSLLSDQPIAEQNPIDQFLTGLWGGVGTEPGGGVPGALGGALGEFGLPSAAVAVIPPKMAKEYGRMLVNKIKAESPALGDIWEDLYRLYPRVVGHVDDVKLQPDIPTLGGPGARTAAYHIGREVDFESPVTDMWNISTDIDGSSMRQLLKAPPLPLEQWATKHGPIVIDPKYMADAVGDPKFHSPDNVSAHELTHAAQALGTNDFNYKYRQENATAGYGGNKFEIGARRAGRNFENLRAAKEPGEDIKATRARLRKVGKDEESMKSASPDVWDWMLGVLFGK